VWTVQPAGVVFDPPARITYPNVDGLRPGQVVDIFSFDHDLGLFVSSGTGTVSPDGAVITSDPGSGITKAGWGYPAPPPPPPGCAKNAAVDMELSPDLIGQDEEAQGNAQGSLDGSGKGCPSSGGSYQWTSDDSNIATVSGSGRTATVRGVALGEVPINVRYLGGGKEAAASKTIRVGTKDVVIIGWIDESLIPLPAGANPGLVTQLNRPSACVLTVLTWYLGVPAGIQGDIDRRYANAFLIKRSGNVRPPSTINADAFVGDRHAYKLMNRLKAFFRVENGKVVDDIYLETVAEVGLTGDPCGLPSMMTDLVGVGEGQRHPFNGRRGKTSQETGVYQLNQARIGIAAQTVFNVLNGHSTPWIWSTVEFDTLGRLVFEDRHHQVFPTYTVYENGKCLTEFTQIPLEDYLTHDATSQAIIP
jgi:hypothetical protein